MEFNSTERSVRFNNGRSANGGKPCVLLYLTLLIQTALNPSYYVCFFFKMENKSLKSNEISTSED